MPFTYSAEGDIETVIMAALKSILTNNLITIVPGSDKLALRTLKAAPLQDDPTKVAPYVIYGPAWEIGRRESLDRTEEIGGPILWETWFRVQCGIPRQTTREAAYSAINELSRRVERTLMSNFDLAGVAGLPTNSDGQTTSADGSEVLADNSPATLRLETARRIFGGDPAQFYGEALTYCKWNFLRERSW